MSTPPRGPKGGRGAKVVGGGRGRGGGNNGRTSTNGNESEGESSTRGGSSRGRGRGDAGQHGNRAIAQAFQQATRGHATSRAPRAPRGGSQRGSTRGGMGNAGVKRSNEAPDQRYNRLKARREQERKDAIAQGFLADPDKPMKLADAVTMVGTCEEMCSEFERARRIYQKDVWGPEMVTTVNENGETKRETDESKMVKKFQRSAAGMDEQLPSDLRPPHILLKTADYLFNDLLVDEESLVTANTFIWDRTRAIRNDFSIQQLTKTPDIRLAIECYEKIARYHILSLHQIGGKSQERAGDSYNWQQDREQLDKTLLSLLTYYENVKERYRSQNESEFRAYWILFQIGNSTAAVEDKVQTWSLDLLKHPRVQKALDLYAAASDVIDYKGPLRPPTPLPVAQQDWQKFWTLVGSKQVSYLMSCVAEIGFNVVRRAVLTTVSMAYYPGGRKEIQDWTLDKMTEVLGFDDEETTRNFIEQSNLEIGQPADGAEYFKITSVRSLGGLPEPTADLPKQIHAWHLVERKRFGRTFPAIIAGMPFKVAKQQGMLVPDWDEGVQAHGSVEEGLFVGDDEDMAVKAQPNALLNPAATSFKPTTTPAFASSPFGQPSTFSSKPSPFGQPSAAPSAFGQPSPFSQSPAFGQPSPILQAPASTSAPQATPAATGFGSFAAPPKSFTNVPGVHAQPPQPAATQTTAAASSIANPFAPSAMVNVGTPSSISASAFTSESAPPAWSNPFANFGKAKPKQVSFSDPPTTSPAPVAPLVQVTPPDGESQAKPFEDPAPTKPSFEFPSNGFSFAKPLSQETKSSSSSNPFGFPAAPNSPSLESTEADTAVVPSTSPFSLPKPANTTSSAAPAREVPQAITQPSLQSPFSSFEFKKPTSGPPSSATTAPSAEFSSFAASQPLKAPSPQTEQPRSDPITTSKAQPPVQFLKPSSAWDDTRKREALDYVAEQVIVDKDRGFFRQYVENIAKDIIIQEMRKEEKRRDNQDADDFRRFVLEFRYAALWKKNVQILKSRRKRKEMKKRLAEVKEMNRRKLQSVDVSMLDSRSLTLEEDLAAFKAEREANRKTKQEEEDRQKAMQEDRERRRSAQTTATNSFDLIGQRPRGTETMPPPSNRAARINSQEVSHGVSATVRKHKRSQTQPEAVLPPNNSRYSNSRLVKELSPASSISTQSALSLLNSGSLLDHHGLSYGAKVSTMKSPYFRLKAAGFAPTWKQDFSTSHRGTKRNRMSGDDLLSNGLTNGYDSSLAQTHKRLRSPMDLSGASPLVRPATASYAEDTNGLGDSVGSSTSSSGVWKRSAEDESLLARARKMREMLEEGESWYKDEITKEELHRSQEFTRSQLGTSRASSTADGSTMLSNGPRDSTSSLPKFYSRVSKFLPREEYGIRREKRKIEDEAPKVNGKAKGMVNGTSSGNRRTVPPPAPTAAKQGGSSWDDAIEL